MTPNQHQKNESIPCTCGRSPTGNCIGWHNLTEDLFRYTQRAYFEELFRLDQEIEDSK